MELNKFLTIVIPCKNEKEIIFKTLDLLNHQENIDNVKVIVCDSSDDGITRPDLLGRLEYKQETDRFDLYVMDGGLPAKARNNGFRIVKTPYVLFLDADVFLLDKTILTDTTKNISNNNLDLVTVKFRTDNGKYNYVYKTFDIIQSVSKLTSPFCLGGFMLTRSDTFRKIKGFCEEVKVAEDYLYSKRIKGNKFKIHNTIVYTTPRRFDSKGVLYMLRLMIGSLLNNNNKSYFKTDKGYWNE
jgi:cellulose synthase/poly-beta-1,6-N-acetylglucosamine synthase-like glycosyltransferase